MPEPGGRRKSCSGEDDEVLEFFQLDESCGIKMGGHACEPRVPPVVSRLEEVEDGGSVRLQALADELGKRAPTHVGFEHVSPVGNREILDDQVEGTFRLNSIGTVGHGGLWKTYGWIDPKKELIGVLLMQRLSSDGDLADEFNAFMQLAAAAITN